MNACYDTLDEIRSALTLLRQNPKTQRRFPRPLWASIVRLTKTIPVTTLCQELHICPANLRHWTEQLRGSNEESAMSFHELRIADLSPVTISAPTIIVDVTSPSGVQMRIQGPSSLLEHLYPLFRG